MLNLPEAIAYIIKKYPHKSELSNARVTKMLYLADWHALINGNEKVTNINWYFDNYGPFVWDVKRAVEESPYLHSIITKNFYGQPKDLFELSDDEYNPKIDDAAKMSLDHVIKITKSLNWSDFIKLVYSTYPISSSAKYTYLNLPDLARAYRQS